MVGTGQRKKYEMIHFLLKLGCDESLVHVLRFRFKFLMATKFSNNNKSGCLYGDKRCSCRSFSLLSLRESPTPKRFPLYVRIRQIYTTKVYPILVVHSFHNESFEILIVP